MNPIRVHASGRYLERSDGTPFLYLADTAWELFHRLSQEEADEYLRDRAAKGFTVVQAVVLSEVEPGDAPSRSWLNRKLSTWWRKGAEEPEPAAAGKRRYASRRVAALPR